ncbi:HECT-type ubiquitin ligase-interacting protein apyA [Aspergillus fruticulosus]
MALHRLKAHSASAANRIDIQLDKDFVVFQGSEQEALAVYLSGNLTMRLKEATTIKYIRLHLRGVRRASLPARTGRKKLCSENEFYSRTWRFHDGYREASKTYPVGEYKYPFDLIMEGSMPASVEGLKEASISYLFTVEIGRRHGRDITFHKPLRVIRVPDLEPCAHDFVLDEVWANKIAYRISIQNRTVALGTRIDVDYVVAPLLGDLKIAFIESQLLEFREFSLDPNNSASAHCAPVETVVCSDRYTQDGECSEKEVEAQRFSRSLHLPRALGECVQDTDDMGVKVSHKLKIHVRMHNPDGHESELRLAIPVLIYLSPYYRVWEDSFCGEYLSPPETMNPSDECPPAYGMHELDRLYMPQDQLA